MEAFKNIMMDVRNTGNTFVWRKPKRTKLDYVSNHKCDVEVRIKYTSKKKDEIDTLRFREIFYNLERTTIYQPDGPGYRLVEIIEKRYFPEGGSPRDKYFILGEYPGILGLSSSNVQEYPHYITNRAEEAIDYLNSPIIRPVPDGAQYKTVGVVNVDGTVTVTKTVEELKKLLE